MIAERHTRTQNLDLALIGNRCTAALVDRNARVVWRRFPPFGRNRTRLRNTWIVKTVLTDAGRQVARDGFRAALRAIRLTWAPLM